MSKKVKNVNVKEVTVNSSTLHYEHPYYVPIDDGDEETIKFYKENGVPVKPIPLPGRIKHFYAIFNADTHEEAVLMQRQYNNWAKQDERDAEKQSMRETSYEALMEEGYNLGDNSSNLEEIIAYQTVIAVLNDALTELTEEKIRLCKMVANGESQRVVADELGIPRRTLRDRKDAVLSELYRKMKDYR